MNKEPKISVITACYNHGRFINEMIESVMNQTFSDYELIIVNDGSTDDTADILQKVADDKIRIIQSENHGPAYARNLAISHAKATIIMNLDADDKIAPELLEKAYIIFSKKNNVGIVHCDAQCFGARTGKFEIGDYSLEAMLFENRINSQSFFRKKDWEKVGGYSDEFVYDLEDWDFWLLIIELGREVEKIPEMLVYYRTYKQLSDSRSGRRKSDRLKAMESQVTIFRRQKKLYLDYPEAWKYFSKIEKKYADESFLIRLVRNHLYKNIQKYYWKFIG